MNTNIELVEELNKRNIGKYDEIINEAVLCEYHDFISPRATPKIS